MKKIIKLIVFASFFVVFIVIALSRMAFAQKEDNLYKNQHYNREKARDYALNWAIIPNKNYYNYINDGGDCTNFVSQVLRAGGMEFVGNKQSATSTKSWFYYSADLPNRTSTWTSANAFNLHFGKDSKRIYKYKEYTIQEALDNWDNISTNIYMGDIVQYSRPNNIAFHSQAITDLIDRETIYFSQHSNSIENFYKDGNLKYYLLGKPNDYNLLIYNIKEEKSSKNEMRNKTPISEKNYNEELIKAIELIRISIEDTRFDNKDYKNEETDKFIDKIEKRIEDIELQMNMRSKSSKELLELLMDRNDL
ncbi:MAG: hypothetical protein E7212_04460 [Clostridium sartagoforme]|nr:hypothetical protein [Clostridium sartagoforme]